MIRSALYVLLLVSLVKGVPNPYFENIARLSGWSSNSNSKDVATGVKIEEIPKEKLRSVVDEFSSKPDEIMKVVKSGKFESLVDQLKPKNSENEPIKIDTDEKKNGKLHFFIEGDDRNGDVQDGNSDEPISIDDFLDQLNEQAAKIDYEEKKEVVGILKKLKNAISDNSIRTVHVVVKGLRHAVDLGIAGSSQRRRSAEKTDGVMNAIVHLVTQFRNWVFGWFGWEPEDEHKHDQENKHKANNESDKDKDKDKDKNKDKDNKKDRKVTIDTFSEEADDEKYEKSQSKENGSDDSSAKNEKGGSDNLSEKKAKPEIVLKPLVKLEDQEVAHTTTNQYLMQDSKHTDVDDESLDAAMKHLANLSFVLEDRLKTREEVDEAVKEAQKKKDHNNKYYIQSELSRKEREYQNDERVWTEDNALKKLEEMDKNFDKMDKKSMVKDILSLSMQPFFYVETYDKIMDMIERLIASEVVENKLGEGDEHKLGEADDYAFKQKLFSLEDSIMQTPKKIYRINRYKLHEEIYKKEKGKHGITQVWTDEQAKTRIDEMNKDFDKTTDKTQMVKDITSMSIQPFLKTDTYNKMHHMIKKLVTEGKVPEADLVTAEESVRRQARFSYVDGILQISEMEEHEKFKEHSEKAAEKRKKLGDTREFTEEKALEEIRNMLSDFEPKCKHSMIKDITNLSMHPLYHVETYDAMSHVIEKLKTCGIAESELKPAIDSLAEERAFSYEHDILKKPEDSFAQKLKDLKQEYLKLPQPLTKEKKKQLLADLKILREQEEFTPNEAKDAYELLKLLMKGNPISDGLNPKEMGELHQVIDNGKKKYLSTEKDSDSHKAKIEDNKVASAE